MFRDKMGPNARDLVPVVEDSQCQVFFIHWNFNQKYVGDITQASLKRLSLCWFDFLMEQAPKLEKEWRNEKAAV